MSQLKVAVCLFLHIFLLSWICLKANDFPKSQVNVMLAWVYWSPPPWQPRRNNSLHLPGLFTRRGTFTCKCSLSYRRLRHKFSSSAFSFTEYEEPNSKHQTHQHYFQSKYRKCKYKSQLATCNPSELSKPKPINLTLCKQKAANSKPSLTAWMLGMGAGFKQWIALYNCMALYLYSISTTLFTTLAQTRH